MEFEEILNKNDEYQEIKYRFKFKDSYFLRSKARLGQMVIPNFIKMVKNE